MGHLGYNGSHTLFGPSIILFLNDRLPRQHDDLITLQEIGKKVVLIVELNFKTLPTFV